MSNTSTPSRSALVSPLSSWAVPTEQGDTIWEKMTREQQLDALQDHFQSKDCTTPTTNSVAEIVARARTDRSPL